LCRLTVGRGNPRTGIVAALNHISAHLFSEDGNRLFVLTNDQTAFILDVNKMRAGQGPPSPTSDEKK
jgi:hypothetical protein